MSSEFPVFFDPTGRRGPKVLAANWAIASVLLGLFVFVAIAILVEPALPPLKLARGQQLTSNGQIVPASDVTEPRLEPEHQRLATDLSPDDVIRYGYLVNWDDNSFASLRRNAKSLDVAIVEWLHLSVGENILKRDDASNETRLKSWVSAEAPSLKLMPLVNNYDPSSDRWLSEETSKMLSSQPARSEFAERLVEYLKDGNYPGLVVDFEELSDTDRDPLVTFIAELGEVFSQLGLKLLVAIRPGDEGYDTRRLAQLADGVILMLYDEHEELGTPGPLAGQGWFEKFLDEQVRDIDRGKLIVSFGSYGYDWEQSGATREVSFQEALELLDESGAELTFDPKTLNPGFAYLGEDGSTVHELWYLDAVTAFNQIASALPYRPAGLALWRLGTEDPAVWSIFGRGRFPDEETLEEVAKLHPGYDILYQGKGEALTVVGGLEEGRRKLRLDREHHLLTNQEIEKFPKGTTIKRWGGGSEKVIALTFDDGPDPKYTPQILDILAEKDVKATFFVVGAAATSNPSILERIYEDGHDIGNHTFSHVNSADVSSEQLMIELNATQRLLEATVGARTRLFRPPYAQDIEPRSINGAGALSLAADLGYITIGMNIDPKDWMRGLPRQIVASVVEGAVNGDGKVVLLHDAGGIRKATVDALPAIIDELRARGFRFVTTHELLRVARADTMPLVEPDEDLVTAVNGLGFSFYSNLGWLFTLLFQLGILLGTTRLILVTIGGLAHSRRKRQDLVGRSESRSIAVLMPAFNEESVICKSIRTLLASSLKNFEIIVIDDGSSDNTADVVRKTFAKTSRVRAFKKPNGGKASALNYGLSKTSAEIVVALDADTVFERDAIKWLMGHFDDPKVGAVAGATVVGNTDNLITRFQALEYVTSQNLDRRTLELVNSITVVPGAIGAWRRDAVLAAGGFSTDTLAEDADLTIQLERMGWKVVYEPNAVARTEAPDTIKAFMKQRFRWMFGTLQAAWKHRSALLRRTNGTGIGLFGLPNIFIFQILFTLISPIIDLMLIWNILAGVRAYHMNPLDGVPPALVSVAIYWGLFQLLDLITSAVAIYIDPRAPVWRLLPLLLIQRFFYRQLLYIVAIKTAHAALKGQLVGWGKLKRSNSVPEALAPT